MRRPGVYELGRDARLVAAVRAAGGFGAGADSVALDLAAFARDGEQIVVPKAGEPARRIVPAPETSAPSDGVAAAGDLPGDAKASESPAGDATAEAPVRRRRARHRHHKKRRHRARANDAAPASRAGESDAPGEPSAPSPADAPQDLVDLNTADAATLATLPGVGDTLAERIVRFRDLSGPFERPEELLDVAGMTDSHYNELEPLVRI